MSSRVDPAIVRIGPAQLLTPSLPLSRPTLTIRRAELGDAEALHVLFNQPEIVYWTIEMPFTTLASVQQRIAQSSDSNYLLVACDGPKVIGTLSLTAYAVPRMRHVAKLGSIAVDPAEQGKGAGSALMRAALDLADQWLNVRRLELMVYSDNLAAIGLYEKFGFVAEGRLQGLAFRQGTYVDVTAMARLHQIHNEQSHLQIFQAEARDS
jgi:putative acetyltransferase